MMGPVLASKIGIRKAFNFSGRASRSEFWWFSIIGLLIILLEVPYYIDLYIDNTAFTFGIGDELWGWISLALGMLIAFPWITAFVRRGHDSGKATWIMLAALFFAWLSFEYLSIFEIVESLNTQSTFPILTESTTPRQTEQPLNFRLLALRLVTFLAFSALLIIANSPASVGPNKYGPNPHEVTP